MAIAYTHMKFNATHVGTYYVLRTQQCTMHKCSLMKFTFKTVVKHTCNATRTQVLRYIFVHSFHICYVFRIRQTSTTIFSILFCLVFFLCVCVRNFSSLFNFGTCFMLCCHQEKPKDLSFLCVLPSN